MVATLGEPRGEVAHGCDVGGLAAAVNTILVTSDLPVMTFNQVCRDAERDPASPEEHREVLLALTLLDYCQLAVPREEILWRPTRAAIWAERLSF